jgi:hypothetical protein
MADTVKHTPGPWQIEGRYEGDLGALYLSTMHPMPIFELQPLVGSRDVHLANARLIAAAPDLLEALMELRFVGNDMEKRRKARAKADAAIDKATGGQ